MSEFSKAIVTYSPQVQARLKELRRLILDTAAKTEGVGQIEEALKWGQPSFLTPESKSGSTIRIDGRRNDPEKYLMYFHCQSGLVDMFKERYGNKLSFEGNRAIVLDANAEVPVEILKHCIAIALTYHLRKKVQL